MTIPLDEQIAEVKEELKNSSAALVFYEAGDDAGKQGQFKRRVLVYDAILTTLRACKEPTEEMVDAGAMAINKQMRGPGAPADWHAAKDCFHAMLNARGG